MKIHELFEARDTSLKDLSDNEIISLIKRDCQPFLNRTDALLFRGIKTAPDYAFKQNVRQDRKPRNMGAKYHEAMDDWFEENVGFKARSQAVFTTGSYEDARGYGGSYAIFPIGDFKFAWSPNIGDLFIMIQGVKYDDIPKELDEAKYQTTDLEAAIDSEYEIMVKCNEYYAVPIYEKAEAAIWARNIFRKS